MLALAFLGASFPGVEGRNLRPSKQHGMFQVSRGASFRSVGAQIHAADLRELPVVLLAREPYDRFLICDHVGSRAGIEDCMAALAGGTDPGPVVEVEVLGRRVMFPSEQVFLEGSPARSISWESLLEAGPWGRQDILILEVTPSGPPPGETAVPEWAVPERCERLDQVPALALWRCPPVEGGAGSE